MVAVAEADITAVEAEAVSDYLTTIYVIIYCQPNLQNIISLYICSKRRWWWI